MHPEFDSYANANGYPVNRWQQLICDCSSSLFRLFSDDAEGAAFSVCGSCEREIDICTSRQFASSVEQNICICDEDQLEVFIGQAMYPDTSDPSWSYVGAHCTNCGLAGVYADWKER